MARYRAAYSPEFRRQLVDLFRAGRNIAELAEEFEPSTEAIRAWIKQAHRDEGRRENGPTSAEREELSRLHREVKQLRQEGDILGKGRGLVCAARRDVVEVYKLMTANPACFPFGPWPACLACRPPASMPGEASTPQRGRAPMPSFCAAFARSTSPRRALMERRACMPSCERKARMLARSASPGSAKISGVSRRRSTRTTLHDRKDRPAPDLVDRNFSAERPKRLWVANITCIPT